MGKEPMRCGNPPQRWGHFWKRNPQNMRKCLQCKFMRNFRTRRRTPNTSPDKFSQQLILGTRTGTFCHQMSLIHMGQEQALNLPGKMLEPPQWG